MDSINEAISQILSLTKVINKDKSKQVRSLDEKNIIKAIAFSWFKNIRPKTNLADLQLEGIDILYKFLLEASEKNTSRKIYLNNIKILHQSLITIRSENIVLSSESTLTINDYPPDFTSLIKDSKMIHILSNRWTECNKCINANAPLSSIIMMGGILEAILLAKINSYSDKSKIFSATTVPIDFKTKKPYPLQEWTLKNYIDVAHELKWISKSTKDVGEVLRDYRNYIHPYKEFSHGIVINLSDAELFWKITKGIVFQLLK